MDGALLTTYLCVAISRRPEDYGPTVQLERTDGILGWVSIRGPDVTVRRFEIGKVYKIEVMEVHDAAPAQ
jgi:hypothetical protein